MSHTILPYLLEGILLGASAATAALAPNRSAAPISQAASAISMPSAIRSRLSSGTYFAVEAARGKVQWPRWRRPLKAATPSPWTLEASSPEVGSDIRLGDDPSTLPADRRAQAEPDVARSYTDPTLVAATFQEGRFEDGGAVDCGYAVSNDGGLTWTRALIPWLTTVAGGPYTRASDPVVAVDLQNNIYINTIGLQSTDSVAILLSKSRDRGRSFDPPLVVYRRPNSSVFLDKNWCAVNTFAHSPHAGRIVVTFTDFMTTNVQTSSGTYSVPIDPIACTYSDDGGTNWTTPKWISPLSCQGSQPFFLPDGSLGVVYWNFNLFNPATTEPSIDLVRSRDGGADFDPPIRITSVPHTYQDPVARSPGFLPAATTDRQAGVIYVAYQAAINGPQILFTKSIDKGTTWSAPQPVNDSPHGVAVFNPAIAVSPDGQHVSIIFYDKRNALDANEVDLYLAESFDGGRTWQPNVRLTSVSSDLLLAPLTPEGRMLGDYEGMAPALNLHTPAVATWVDTRTGSPDPFAVRVNRMRGTTFPTWLALRFSPPQLADSNLASASATPAGDGLPNLFKYAVGLEPFQFAANPAFKTSAFGPPLNEFQTDFSMLAVATDLAVAWQSSTNLANWAPATPLREQQRPSADPTRKRIEAEFSTSPNPHRYYRLTVLETNAP